MPAVKYQDLADRREGESFLHISRRRDLSREIQRERFKGSRVHSNSQMTPRQIRKFCEPDQAGSHLPELVTDSMGFPTRTYNGILKVSRTIADLDGNEGIGEPPAFYHCRRGVTVLIPPAAVVNSGDVVETLLQNRIFDMD